MGEKKEGGFLKRLFRFGQPEAQTQPLEKVEGSTSDTSIGNASEPDPVAHTDAAANVIVDTEAGATPQDDQGGITPIKDTPPPKPEPEPIETSGIGSGIESASAEPKDAKAGFDGVFGAPGETRSDGRTATPPPLSDTPEPPPDAAHEDHAFPQGAVDLPDEAGADAFDGTNGAVRSTSDGEADERARPTGTAESEPSGTDAAARGGWFSRMRNGLSRSSGQLTQSITSVFTKRKLDEDTLQDLEDILVQADLGVATASAITERLAQERMDRDIDGREVRRFVADEIERVLSPVAAELELDLDHEPHVILVVGVNGSGKTTTIGKLAQKLYEAGFSTALVAGDTFRAAAIEQLKIWGERTRSPVYFRDHGADSAALAFDAYEKAREEGRDVMLMDTAGRLQNKAELMAELEKIVRVLRKHDATAPHTVLLTLDATTGQNALNQVEIFKDVAGVNGLVMTKLDGTARGGILVAIARRFSLPVYFIGVGEQVDDLEPFEARDFARAIVGLESEPAPTSG